MTELTPIWQFTQTFSKKNTCKSSWSVSIYSTQPMLKWITATQNEILIIIKCYLVFSWYAMENNQTTFDDVITHSEIICVGAGIVVTKSSCFHPYWMFYELINKGYRKRCISAQQIYRNSTLYGSQLWAEWLDRW